MSIKRKDTILIINNNLKKYNESITEYYKNKAKNLMFHKKTHFTAIFTEYLIMDDNQEFLNEYYPVDKSLTYLLILIKIQYSKFFSPIIVNNWGRNILNYNKKCKVMLIKFLSEKSKETTENKSKLLTNQKEFSNILPSDLSENTIVDQDEFTMTDNKALFINNLNLKTKENPESESSTIDNVNANNDISISLDFKINPKYEDKLLFQNMNFIKEKNGNDEEVIKILKYLKPINTMSLYKRNNRNRYINNNNNYHKEKNNLLYLFYLNNNNNNNSNTKKHADNEILTSNNQINTLKLNQNSKNNFSNVNNNNNTNNTNNNNTHRSTLFNTPNTCTSNISSRKNKSKNTSLSGNHTESKNLQNKNNYRYHCSQKYNTHCNNRYDNIFNNKSPNIAKNIYSDHSINKTINSKLNNNNINDKYQKKTLINQRNQENNKILISQNYSELKMLASHGNFKSTEKDKFIENTDTRTKSSKYFKTNKKIIFDRHSVDNSNFNAKMNLKQSSNSSDKTINLNKMNFIKPGLPVNDYKNLKKIIGKKKLNEVSPNINDKNRLFLKYKEDNSNDLTKTMKEKHIKQDKLQGDFNQTRVIECHIIKKKSSKRNIIISKRKNSDDLGIREYK